jgi:hypothetical protein
MSVTIDEITADVEPPETPAAPGAPASPEQTRDAELRRNCDLLARIARRAARLRAD